jgi:hypothetical protein
MGKRVRQGRTVFQKPAGRSRGFKRQEKRGMKGSEAFGKLADGESRAGAREQYMMRREARPSTTRSRGLG